MIFCRTFILEAHEQLSSNSGINLGVDVGNSASYPEGALNEYQPENQLRDSNIRPKVSGLDPDC
jgi:hypothetical protein